jgi:predicted TIM-barrel fold metal-dependent hydrolase
VSAASETDENPLVDAHFHLWTTDLPLTDTAWHHPPTDGSTERFLKIMDEHAILFGVVAAASPHGTYNDYVRAALGRHKRLRATATVDPETSIYELERMREDGFVGIRFVWSVRDEVPDINSAPYRKLLRRVVDLDWHVHITDRPHRIADTIGAVQRSGAKLVIDHMGHFDLPEGINSPAFQSVLRAVENGRTWVKLSAGFRFSTPEVAAMYAKELVRVVGGERLLWASDWPFAAFEDKVTYADTLAAFREWVPDARLRRQIGGETPLRLYFT